MADRKSGATEKPSGSADALRVRRISDGSVRVELGTQWDGINIDACLKEVRIELAKADQGAKLVFPETGFDRSDTVVVSTILELIRIAQARGLEINTDDLPDSIRPLLKLALVVPRKPAARQNGTNRIEQIGKGTVEFVHSTRRFVEFLGELVVSFGRLLIGKSRFRARDFWVILQDCGAGALPIVSLLAVLTGTILGFVGAVQLRKFGATIYMTDLVGLAMSREMAAIMTGIIMAGRTGASFAAQIGSMNVNQEVDALKTFSLSPVEFLVLPRTLALVLMMPILTLYANVLGWIGGYLVAIPMGINPAEYWNQLTESINFGHIAFGISKSFFFGIVVATTGCYYGLRSGRNSAAVGEATTRAVVAGITWIIVLDALFAFMDEALNY